ncbi:MAG: PQQ-binding-like beta-propeller repeat protein [Acidobacteria bacterium]|nr:PQQ-binding-like beta-propeller repeat protein [Acidobacteriota bacterium]MCY3932181.1 PQQ-binding-like beta-propeller repeat protein [Acidobacteriota bacterium]
MAALAAALSCPPLPGQTGASGDWPAFGGDPGNTKYSKLDRIDRDNFQDVEIAWRWRSIAADTEVPDSVRRGQFKTIPLEVDGRVFVATSLSQVAAIDAGTGDTLWTYDPESWRAGRPANEGFQHRGVAYWTDGERERVLLPTHHRRLVSLDAATGKPDPDFGDGGDVEMTPHLGREVMESRTTHSSPPAVCGNTVIVGSIVADGVMHKESPPGFVRAYDIPTGDLAWVFHTIPQDDEFGTETWENESWRYSGNTNVWSTIAVDEETGTAYLPVSTATNDLYGGHRLGDNLYSESIVAVDCQTGERRWHYQFVHHGLWDCDPSTAPNLFEATVDGEPVRGVVQVTKQAFAFVFDRTSGEPVWEIEEREVPPSDVPGERAAPTQPFPTKPAPYDRQGITEDDLIDWTPELRAEALEIVGDYDLVPLYTPPRVEGAGKPTIQLPSEGGGTNWTGAALDPESGVLYVPSYTLPVTVSLTRPDPNRSNLNFVPERWYEGVDGPRGLPLVKPPHGRITAIGLSTGEHLWMVPHGVGPVNHPAIAHLKLRRLGKVNHQPGALVTRTLLFVTAMREHSGDPAADEPDIPAEISVYDKGTGEYLGGIELPDTPHSNLISYEHGGRQYLAVATGGGRYYGGGGTPPVLVALALPRKESGS